MPPAAGEARDAQAARVNLRKPGKIVDSPAHRQIEKPQRVRAHQVQVGAVIVLILLLVEFAHPDPLGVEGHDSALGEIDARLLCVLRGLTNNMLMPLDIQDGRTLAGGGFRFVKDGRRPVAGNDFKAQFPPMVASVIYDRAHFFEARWRIHPLLRPTVECDVIEDVLAQLRRFPGPLLRASGRREFGNPIHHVALHLVRRDRYRLDWRLKHSRDRLGSSLGLRKSRAYQSGKNEPLNGMHDSASRRPEFASPATVGLPMGREGWAAVVIQQTDDSHGLTGISVFIFRPTAKNTPDRL